MHLSDIRALFEYNYWANERLLSIVRTVTTEQFLKDVGSSHGGIQGTLVHIMGAEEIWLHRWKHEAITHICKAEQFPAFERLVDHWKMVEMGVIGFCHMLKTDDDILAVCDYADLKGNRYAQPLYQLMQHLANHSSYHRGQVVTMLRQMDVKPAATDLVVFYREQIAQKS